MMDTHAPIAALTLTLAAALGCSDNAPAAQNETGDPADDPTPAPVLADNPANPPSDVPPAPADPPPALDFEMPAIDGTPINLADYHGRVVLIVNTASRCGLTPQYEQLQQLHEQYADDGLAILGFPANNFRAQEPGSNEEIATFCEQNYGVGFDMFAKISVKGDDQHPLYTYLTSAETNPQYAGDITWNFEKFLLGRDGHVVARFTPQTPPNAPEVLAAIQAELEKPAQP